MLVVHIHAIHDLAVSALDSSSEVIIYATFTIGSIKKATEQKVYNTKNDSILVFNEVKYFPIVVCFCLCFSFLNQFLNFSSYYVGSCDNLRFL